MTEAQRTIDDCVRYWIDTGVPDAAIDDMRRELTAHLEAAEADGRPVATVVGPDPAGFAEAWASERRGVTPASMVEVHGADTLESLDVFYATVVRLFRGGRLGGVRFLARLDPAR